MATVADSPSAKQPREKSVVVLETLVMAAGGGWELGCCRWKCYRQWNICHWSSSPVPCCLQLGVLLNVCWGRLRYSAAAFATAGHVGHCGLAGSWPIRSFHFAAFSTPQGVTPYLWAGGFLHKSDLLLQMLAREQLASQGALLDISSSQVTGRFWHADLGSSRSRWMALFHPLPWLSIC